MKTSILGDFYNQREAVFKFRIPQKLNLVKASEMDTSNGCGNSSITAEVAPADPLPRTIRFTDDSPIRGPPGRSGVIRGCLHRKIERPVESWPGVRRTAPMGYKLTPRDTCRKQSGVADVQWWFDRTGKTHGGVSSEFPLRAFRNPTTGQKVSLACVRRGTDHRSSPRA